MITFQAIILRAGLQSQKLLTNATFPLLLSKPICSHFHCCKRSKGRDSLPSGLRQCEFLSQLSCFRLCWNILLFISPAAKYLGLLQIITGRECVLNLTKDIAYILSCQVFKWTTSIDSFTAAAIYEKLAIQNTFFSPPTHVQKNIPVRQLR